MLEMVKGCYVPCADKLKEEYMIDKCYITANVNASKIEEIIQHFIIIQKELIFFILELPANAVAEEKIQTDKPVSLHKDVYYIDGLTNEQALILFMKYKELLINDGLCRFGFGVQDNSAEIMKNEYNIMTFWTNNMQKYSLFFDTHGIHITDNYISAWDTFSSDNPGQCKSVTVNDISVYDLPEKLKEYGMYFAETR